MIQLTFDSNIGERQTIVNGNGELGTVAKVLQQNEKCGKN